MTNEEIRDQLKFAREGAQNLAKRNGYQWIRWLERPNGRTTAAFERDGSRWSLDFYWTPKEDLGALAKYIEQMDFAMRVAMKEFGSVKLGQLMRAANESEGMIH